MAGVDIYRQLKEYRGKISVRIEGRAASAASLVAMAGGTVSMAADAVLMIHGTRITVEHATAKELRLYAQSLEASSKEIAEIYSLKTRLSKADLIALMEQETYFTAQEAKALGFVDEITPAASCSAVWTEAKGPNPVKARLLVAKRKRLKDELRDLKAARGGKPMPRDRHRELAIMEELFNF